MSVRYKRNNPIKDNPQCAQDTNETINLQTVLNVRETNETIKLKNTLRVRGIQTIKLKTILSVREIYTKRPN